MKKHLRRDTSLKDIVPPSIEGRKAFEDHKNLISQEFPLKSPTKKVKGTRTRRESKKILNRKRSFNLITHKSTGKKVRPKISRRKSFSKLFVRRNGVGQFGVKVKMTKVGKSIIKTKNTIARDDRGKRIVKKNVVTNSAELVRPGTGKRIIREKNNTSSVFRPRRLLKRKIVLFKRDPKINIIAGTPGVIEKYQTGKGQSPLSKRSRTESRLIRPLFDRTKKRIAFKPLPRPGSSHCTKRMSKANSNRRKSYALPMEKVTRKERNTFRKACTGSSVRYNILAWK